jgi:hypothetical protein
MKHRDRDRYDVQQEADVRIGAIRAWCDHALAGECPRAIALTAIEGLASSALHPEEAA